MSEATGTAGEPIGVAIIGLGAIGKRHLECVLATPAWRFVAGAARTQSTRDLVERAGGVFCTDYRSMLDTVRPDAVIDAGPTDERVNVALACAAAGTAVLLEKPFADTMEGARTIFDAVSRAGIPVLVGHHRRHNPIVREARAALARGDIGELRLASTLWSALKPDAYYDDPWRRGPGGGPLITNLVHEIDTLRFLCGEVAEVRAFASNAVRGMVNPDTAAAALAFASGAMGVVGMSDVVASPWAFELTSGEDPGFPNNAQNHMMLMGSEGSLAIPSLELWRHPSGRRLGWRGPLDRSRIAAAPDNPLMRQMQHFADVVRGVAAPVSSAASGVRSLALTLAIQQAAGGECTVKPEEPMQRGE